jgi:hypothetical protein
MHSELQNIVSQKSSFVLFYYFNSCLVCRLRLHITDALDEVPRKIRVAKNLFLDMGVFLEEPNFVKRFVGRRYPSVGGRSQGVCTKLGQAHPFGRHMVLDGVVLALLKRQTKQRRRRYVARTFCRLAMGGLFSTNVGSEN